MHHALCIALIPIAGLSQSSNPSPLKPSVCFPESTVSHGSFPLLFIPTSFILPFLLLPIFLFLMFHKWVKPYDKCLSLLDLFRLALSPPVPSMLQQIQIKTTLRYRFTPVRMETLTRQETTNVVEDVEKGKPSHTVGGNASWYSHFGKQCGSYSKS